jgi:hypothetical protein
MNSTEDSIYKGLNYDRFLAPDLNVDEDLRNALQKLKEQETASSCNKMAVYALIHTCATYEGDDEAQGATEATLDEEKSLFSARLAVCEFSDSSDRSLVPAECASFVPTETNTKKRSWYGYVSNKGQQKPIPHYPDYDQATRRDRDRCVDALKATPQTWSSYSNAKQSANQWCPAVRNEIEKAEMLKMYRAMAENALLTNDAIRSQTEALFAHMEATRFLTTQLRKFSQDTLETHEALQQMWRDDHDTMQAWLKDYGVQFQAQADWYSAALEDVEVKRTNMLERMFSAWKDEAVKHNKEVAIAQARAAEDSRAQIEFELEIFAQQIQQSLYSVSSAGEEVAAGLRETLQDTKQLQLQMSGLSEEAATANELISNVAMNAKELQSQQAELSSAINDTRNSLAALDSQVLAITVRISSIVSIFTGLFDSILAVAWHYRYAVGAGLVFSVMCRGGWPILCLAVAGFFKLLRKITSNLTALAQPVLVVAGSFFSCALSALNRYTGYKVALLMILGVAGIADYSVAVETPIAYWQRLENGDLSLFEAVHVIVIVALSFVLLAVISTIVWTRRESQVARSEEPERYDTKNSAV